MSNEHRTDVSIGLMINKLRTDEHRTDDSEHRTDEPRTDVSIGLRSIRLVVSIRLIEHRTSDDDDSVT